MKVDRMSDDIFDVVASEIQRNDLKPGLMARAIAQSGGNENAAKSIYIRLRAQQIQVENRNRQQAPHDSGRFLVFKGGYREKQWHLTITPEGAAFTDSRSEAQVLIRPRDPQYILDFTRGLFASTNLTIRDQYGTPLFYFLLPRDARAVLKAWWVGA